MRTRDFFEPIEGKVAIGIRFHSMEMIELLKNSLTSAFAQEGCSPDVIIACQDFSDDEISNLEESIGPIQELFLKNSIIINKKSTQTGDRRSSLLNAIIDYVVSKEYNYVMFLDYDDAILPFAIRVLVNSCNYSGMKLAFADLYAEEVFLSKYNDMYTIALADIFGISQKRRADLIYGNFLPIHSYIMDVSIFKEGLRYNENLTRLEDYDMLLNIAKEYQFSNLAKNIKIGFYRFYNAKIPVNTTGNIFSSGDEIRDSEWRRCYNIIINTHGRLKLMETLGELQIDNIICDHEV